MHTQIIQNFPQINPKDLVSIEGSHQSTWRYLPKDQPPLIIQMTTLSQTAIQVQQQAATLNIAPSIIHHQSTPPMLMTQLIPGSTPTHTTLQQEDLLTKIAQSLHDLHQAPCPTLPQSAPYQSVWAHYQTLTPHHALLSPAQHQACQGFQALAWLPATSLTHHDLHPKNLLITEHTAYLIDWEYSGLGCPYQDLVSLAHFLPPSHYALWLAIYFGTPPTDQHWYWFNRYLSLRLASSALWALTLAIHYDPKQSLPDPQPILALQTAFLTHTFDHTCAKAWWTLSASLLACWQQQLEKTPQSE